MILKDIKDDIIQYLELFIDKNTIEIDDHSISQLYIFDSDQKFRIKIVYNNFNLYITNIIFNGELKHKGIGKHIIKIIFDIAKKNGSQLFLVDMVDSFYVDLLLRGASRTNIYDCLSITDETILDDDLYKKNEKIYRVIYMSKYFRNIDDLFTAASNIAGYIENIDFDELNKIELNIIKDLIYINICSMKITLYDFGNDEDVYKNIYELLNNNSFFEGCINTYNNIELNEVSDILQKLSKLDYTKDIKEINDLLYQLKEINRITTIEYFCKHYNITLY